MNKKLRKVLLALLITAGCLVAGAAGVYFGLIATLNSTQAAYERIAPLELENVADGSYKGRAGAFICSVELEVQVRDHRITEINILNQISGGKYQAKDMLPRIVDAQSLEVDTVSGATLSSKTILVAVNDALNGR